MIALSAVAAPLAQITTGPEETNRLLQTMVDGFALGAIYAVLALGFVIIFKATQVLSFAHGALAAMGAFLVASFATLIDIPGRWMPETTPAWLTWILAVLVALVAAAIVGMVVERVFLRPMVGEALFAVAIVTLGLDFIIRNITNDWLGSDPRPLGDPWGTNLLDLGPVTIAHTQVFQLIVTVLLVIGIALFFRTKTGVSMRATAFDQEAARAQGISVGRVFAIAWAIGAALAAIGGIFASVFPRRAIGVDPTTAFFAFRAFPAIILGGLDSVVGAVVGGFAIGLAEEFAVSYLEFEALGSGFGGIVPYLVMLLVLLLRPYGLFGTEEIRRV